jgi:hypothetical protein
LLGILNRHHVADRLNYTDQRFIPALIPADGTNSLVTEVATGGAMLDFFPHFRNRPGKENAVFRRALHEMKNQAKGSLFTYSRQAGKGIYGFFYKFGGELHKGLFKDRK